MEYKVEIKCETMVKEEPMDDENDNNDFDALESTVTMSTSESECITSQIHNDSSTLHSPPRKRKRGVRNEHKYKRNIIKESKIKGKSHVNWKGQVVDKRKTGEPCKCRHKCFEQISEENRKLILNNFYEMKSKNEQDIFLQGMIDSNPVKRIKKIGNKQPKSFNYNYFVIIDGNRREICLKAFLSLLAVTQKRVYRICKLLSTNSIPQDNRGKIRSANAISENICDLISQHIKSFPSKTSHYSTHEFTYLDSRLTITKMYRLFKKKHPEIKVSHWFYWKYFKENFNLHFGRPQISCSFCEEKGALLRSPLSDSAKQVIAAELIVHKRRSKKFFNKTEEVKKLSIKQEDVTDICCHFMSNLLPDDVGQ